MADFKFVSRYMSALGPAQTEVRVLHGMIEVAELLEGLAAAIRNDLRGKLAVELGDYAYWDLHITELPREGE